MNVTLDGDLYISYIIDHVCHGDLIHSGSRDRLAIYNVTCERESFPKTISDNINTCLR